MPKETISDTPDADTAIVVTWAVDSDVNIGLIGPDGQPIPDDAVSNGWFSGLRRDTCNKLIKTLQRARDQAYGADA